MKAVTSVEVATGKKLKEWKWPVAASERMKVEERVCDAFISPDGKFIAWHVDKGDRNGPPGLPLPPYPTALIVTDTATDKTLYRKEFRGSALFRFVFSGDGIRFFAGDDDRSTSGGVRAFPAEGDRAFPTGDDKITMYDSATGKKQFSLDVASSGDITPSPDGKRFVIVSNVPETWEWLFAEVRMWDLESKKPRFDVFSWFPGTRYSTWIFSGDGRTLVQKTDTRLRLFDAKTGRERKVSSKPMIKP